MTRIKGDEGELDALATYLEAVQVFLHQRCYIEQPWAPSLGTKMAPGERTGRISCLSFRANFPNLESVGKCRSNWTRQELRKAFEHAQRRTVSPTAPGFSETPNVCEGGTSHGHLSALDGPDIAHRALPSKRLLRP